MEYIFMVIACLIFGFCILSLFIEQELLERTVEYNKEKKELKILKYRNNKVVDRKIYKGYKAVFLHIFFR